MLIASRICKPYKVIFSILMDVTTSFFGSFLLHLHLLLHGPPSPSSISSWSSPALSPSFSWFTLWFSSSWSSFSFYYFFFLVLSLFSPASSWSTLLFGSLHLIPPSSISSSWSSPSLSPPSFSWFSSFFLLFLPSLRPSSSSWLSSFWTSSSFFLLTFSVFFLFVILLFLLLFFLFGPPPPSPLPSWSLSSKLIDLSSSALILLGLYCAPCFCRHP